MAERAYRRILLKVSGEALMGDAPGGIDTSTVARVAAQIHAAQATGVQIAIVVGGGNIFRGMQAAAAGMDRATADYGGMLATIINALALQDALEKTGATVRTGRANPALVESLRVDYYGTPTPLQQLASVGVPEARLLTIQPYDKGSLEAIEKAIQKSDLGLNPNSDGTIIRLVIPQLTEDRRKELVRVVHKKVEDGRVSIRNVRREAHEMLRDLRKEKDISDDHEHDAQEDLQKITDKFVGQASEIGQEKEEELLEV